MKAQHNEKVLYVMIITAPTSNPKGDPRKTYLKKKEVAPEDVFIRTSSSISL